MDKFQYTIREIDENELRIISDIAYKTWPIAYKNIISEEQIEYMLHWMYSLPSLQKQLTEESCTFYTIRLGDTDIGFASLGPGFIDQQPCLKLHKLYVLPEHQLSGAGSTLLQFCIQQMEKLGHSLMTLQVNRNNTALAFYIKHRFQIYMELCSPIGNGFYMDDYILVMKDNSD